MNAIELLINSFQNFYGSVVNMVSVTATLCVIAEIAYVGIMIATGKFTQPNEMIIKMISIGFTLFLCSHLLQFGEIMRYSLEGIANQFISKALNNASIKINMASPWSAGWTMIQEFIKNLFEMTERYGEVASESLIKETGGSILSTLNPARFLNLIAIGVLKWFMRIVGFLFVIVIVYSMIYYYMALLEYYFIVLLSAIFLVFSLFQHTKFISEKCLSSVFSHVVKIGVLRIILGVAFLIVNNGVIGAIENAIKSQEASGNWSFGGGFLVVLSQIILGGAIYYLVNNGSQIASNFVTGGVSTNGLSLGTFAAKAAGAAAVGGLWAASKGVSAAKSIGNGAAKAAGEAQAAHTASGGSKATAIGAGLKSLGGSMAKGAANAATFGVAGKMASLGSAVKSSLSQNKQEGFNKYAGSLTQKGQDGQLTLSKKGEKNVNTAINRQEKQTGQSLSEGQKEAFKNQVIKMGQTGGANA